LALTQCVKYCSGCKDSHTIDNFGKDKHCSDGLAVYCKEYRRLINRNLYHKKSITKINVKTKHCHGCGQIKQASEFNHGGKSKDGLKYYCKQCDTSEARRKRSNTYIAKQCSVCNCTKDINNFHKDKMSSDCRFYACKICVKYAFDHLSDASNQLRKDYNKRNITPEIKLRRTFRRMILVGLKRKGSSKAGKSIIKHLPYTFEQLKIHIEALWEPWMNWDNHGTYNKNKQTWHIDHIVPQSMFPYKSMEDEDFQGCWKLSNLRPLDALENMKKGNRCSNS
jgi:hypothetical protein